MSPLSLTYIENSLDFLLDTCPWSEPREYVIISGIRQHYFNIQDRPEFIYKQINVDHFQKRVVPL